MTLYGRAFAFRWLLSSFSVLALFIPPPSILPSSALSVYLCPFFAFSPRLLSSPSLFAFAPQFSLQILSFSSLLQLLDSSALLVFPHRLLSPSFPLPPSFAYCFYFWHRRRRDAPPVVIVVDIRSGHLVKQTSISHGALNVIDLSIRMCTFMSFAFCLWHMMIIVNNSTDKWTKGNVGTFIHRYSS